MSRWKNCNRWSMLLIAATVASAGVIALIACDSADLPTTVSHPQAFEDENGYLRGVTASPIFATTVPPPPPPPPPPTPEPEPPPGQPGRFNFKGVLLVSQGTCPGCTLTLKQGSAVVSNRAEVGYQSGGSLSFDQFNQLLRPGLPLKVKGDVENGTNIADSVRVDSRIQTSGSIDRSSAQVRQDREFFLDVRGSRIHFKLSPGATTDTFAAGTAVDVTADVVDDGLGGTVFLAVRVLLH